MPRNVSPWQVRWPFDANVASADEQLALAGLETTLSSAVATGAPFIELKSERGEVSARHVFESGVQVMALSAEARQRIEGSLADLRAAGPPGASSGDH